MTLPIRTLALILGIALAAATGAATTIDDLQLAQSVSTGGTASSEVTPGGGEVVVGGARDLAVTTDNAAVTADVATGALVFVVPAATAGSAVATWDGVDGAPATLDATGLGGADLTDGGAHDALSLSVVAAAGAPVLTIEVYTNAASWSATSFTLPDTASTTAYLLPYADFVAGAGAGATFSNVGAVVLRLSGSDASATLGPIATAAAAPALTVTQRDLDATALGTGTGSELASTPRSPGDSYTVSLTITNTGDDAVDVSVDQLLDTDLSTVGSFRSTPVVRRDVYSGCGNTTLASDGSTVLGLIEGADNDYDPDGQSLTVTSVQATTDEGGSVTLDAAATGAFTYLPPAGFTGVDRFTYTVEDPDGNAATGEVLVSLENTVWFVDSSAAGSNEGTQANPFTDLSMLDGTAGDVDGPGDIIFVYAGSSGVTPYAGGIALEADQKLIGEGVGLSGCTTIAAGATPVIAVAGANVVELGSDNTVSGLLLQPSDAAATALAGIGFGTATLSSLALDGVGAALDLTTGTLSATIDRIVTTGNAAAVGLDGVGGSLTVSDGAGADTSVSNAASGISVSNAPSGATFDFADVSVGAASSGVSLTSSASASFAFSSLDVTTTAGPGLRADTVGTLSLGGTTNTVSATGGPAVDLSSVTLGTNATFSTLASTSSTTGPGIRLSNVAGSFVFSGGSTTVTNVGGGQPGIQLLSSDAQVLFATATINGTTGDGILVTSMNGPVTFTTVTVDGAGGAGIDLDSNAGTVAVNGGAIGATTPPTGIGVDLNGGAANVTIAAAITTTGGTAVQVTGRTGGGATFSGAVSHNASAIGIDVSGNSAGSTTFSSPTKVINSGAATAVNLSTNAAHAVSFTNGGLDIDTSGTATAFLAGGGGAVEVTGSGNTVRTNNSGGTGTAVSISNVTIGASGVTFERVDVTGAATGMVLNTTGSSGGFSITGDAGSTANGSGGTLASITGSAIELTDTMSFALDQLNMSGVADHGIAGVRVDGLSVRNGSFTNMGNADSEDVFSFDRDTFGDNGLVGAAVFENLTVTGFAERAIDIVNEGIGSLDLDVLDVSASDNNDIFGEDAIRVQTEGAVDANVLVSGGTFDNVELDVLAYFAQGTGTNTVEMTNVTSTNGGGPDDNPNGGGVAIIASGGSSTTFDINANNLAGVQGAAVQIIGLPGAGQTVTLNGTIGGPISTDANSLGSDNADGIDLDFDGDPGGTSTIGGAIVVQNNTINFDDDGIGIDLRDAAGTMSVTIRDNTLNGVAGGDGDTADIDDGIFIFTDDDVFAPVNQLNVEVIDNEINGISASKNVIEIVDVRDGNTLCFGATGNSIGSGSGSIELDTDAAVDLVVDATSAANLSSLNNGIPVNEAATPTYSSGVDCIP